MTISASERLNRYVNLLQRSGLGITCDHCQSDQTLNAVREGYRVPKCTEANFCCSECKHHIGLRKINHNVWINDVIKFDLERKPERRISMVKHSIFGPSRIGFRRD